MKERDHIGFDPIAWVDRLIDVAAGSQFRPVEKTLIDKELQHLRAKLFTVNDEGG